MECKKSDRAGSLMTVMKEMSEYELDLVGVRPLLWSSGQSFWLQIQRS
jgi:hypothetical protein